MPHTKSQQRRRNRQIGAKIRCLVRKGMSHRRAVAAAINIVNRRNRRR